MSNFFRNVINRIRRIIRRGDRDNEWVKVGVVFNPIVYPLLQSSEKYDKQTVLCTREGLKFEGVYDGSFVVYRAASGVACTVKEFKNLDTIVIRRNVDGVFTLDAEMFHSVQFDFNDVFENVSITTVWIHTNPNDDVIFVRDCGQVASAWVSKYIDKKPNGFRLGYYNESDHKAYLEQHKLRWGRLLNSDPNKTIHLKANNRYSMLNLASLDKINKIVKSVESKIMEFDFRPNIVIQTEAQDAFKEFSWKEVKIEKCTFEITESCNECRQRQIQSLFDKLHIKNATEKQVFVLELRSQIKEATDLTVTAAAATLAIDMKITCDGGPIKHGDPVYFRRKRVT